MQKEEAAGLLKKESLGTQTINGVVAEGTRTTRTIPAGQIGNEKAAPDRFRAVVFGGSSDCVEEHAHRSANWHHDVHRDECSAD